MASRGKAGRSAQTCIVVDEVPGDHGGGAGDRAQPAVVMGGRRAGYLRRKPVLWDGPGIQTLGVGADHHPLAGCG